MHSTDKEVFQLEWTIVEDNLHLLNQQVGEGPLSDAQFARYQALQQVIGQRRPTLQRLFDSR